MFKLKYEKYKAKYLQLKNQLGGADPVIGPGGADPPKDAYPASGPGGADAASPTSERAEPDVMCTMEVFGLYGTTNEIMTDETGYVKVEDVMLASPNVRLEKLCDVKVSCDTSGPMDQYYLVNLINKKLEEENSTTRIHYVCARNDDFISNFDDKIECEKCVLTVIPVENIKFNYDDDEFDVPGAEIDQELINQLSHNCRGYLTIEGWYLDCEDVETSIDTDGHEIYTYDADYVNGPMRIVIHYDGPNCDYDYRVANITVHTLNMYSLKAIEESKQFELKELKRLDDLEQLPKTEGK